VIHAEGAESGTGSPAGSPARGSDSRRTGGVEFRKLLLFMHAPIFLEMIMRNRAPAVILFAAPKAE
jgi:hypothetical protein